jgi:hypothetical protein
MFAKRVEASIVMLREELVQLAQLAPAAPAATSQAAAAPDGRWGERDAQSLAGSPKQSA